MQPVSKMPLGTDFFERFANLLTNLRQSTRRRRRRRRPNLPSSSFCSKLLPEREAIWITSDCPIRRNCFVVKASVARHRLLRLSKSSRNNKGADETIRPPFLTGETMTNASIASNL